MNLLSAVCRATGHKKLLLCLDLNRLQLGEKEKRSDRGQPSQILQNRLVHAHREGTNVMLTGRGMLTELSFIRYGGYNEVEGGGHD